MYYIVHGLDGNALDERVPSHADEITFRATLHNELSMSPSELDSQSDKGFGLSRHKDIQVSFRDDLGPLQFGPEMKFRSSLFVHEPFELTWETGGTFVLSRNVQLLIADASKLPYVGNEIDFSRDVVRLDWVPIQDMLNIGSSIVNIPSMEEYSGKDTHVIHLMLRSVSSEEANDGCFFFDLLPNVKLIDRTFHDAKDKDKDKDKNTNESRNRDELDPEDPFADDKEQGVIKLSFSIRASSSSSVSVLLILFVNLMIFRM